MGAATLLWLRVSRNRGPNLHLCLGTKSQVLPTGRSPRPGGSRDPSHRNLCHFPSSLGKRHPPRDCTYGAGCRKASSTRLRETEAQRGPGGPPWAHPNPPPPPQLVPSRLFQVPSLAPASEGGQTGLGSSNCHLQAERLQANAPTSAGPRVPPTEWGFQAAAGGKAPGAGEAGVCSPQCSWQRRHSGNSHSKQTQVSPGLSRRGFLQSSSPGAPPGHAEPQVWGARCSRQRDQGGGSPCPGYLWTCCGGSRMQEEMPDPAGDRPASHPWLGPTANRRRPPEPGGRVVPWLSSRAQRRARAHSPGPPTCHLLPANPSLSIRPGRPLLPRL